MGVGLRVSREPSTSLPKWFIVPHSHSVLQSNAFRLIKQSFMQAETGAGRDPPSSICGSQTGLFLYLWEGSEILLPKSMIILGEQVKDLKSRSQADPGKQLAFPPGAFGLLQGSFTVWKAPAGNFQKSPSVIWPWLLFSEVSVCSWCMFVHVFGNLTSFSNWLAILIQWKESYHPKWQYACIQENLYLPADPWGEGIILFCLINFYLLLLFLHVACFLHKDTASLWLSQPHEPHTEVLVVLQSSQCRCLCPFLKSFGSISMPACDEGTLRLSLLHSSLFFLLSSVTWNGLLSPRGSVKIHVFLISWHSQAGFSFSAVRGQLQCHSLSFWSVRVQGPDSVLINGFSIWKYMLPFLQCFPNGMSAKGQEIFFLFPICNTWASLGALGLCCGSLLMQVSWGL